MGILMALIFGKTMFKGEAVPFVMELPNYRLPGAKNVGQLLWEKAKDFLQRAFTVIFVATIVIWFLQTFDLHLKIPKTVFLQYLPDLLHRYLSLLALGNGDFPQPL